MDINRHVIPLAKRPGDIAIVAFFLVNILFITYVVDIPTTCATRVRPPVSLGRQAKTEQNSAFRTPDKWKHAQKSQRNEQQMGETADIQGIRAGGVT